MKRSRRAVDLAGSEAQWRHVLQPHYPRTDVCPGSELKIFERSVLKEKR